MKMKYRTLLAFAVLLIWHGVFSGNCMADPIIDSVSPITVAIGQEVHIFGQQFGGSQGASAVTFFDGITADQINSWSDSEIVCQVPGESH